MRKRSIQILFLLAIVTIINYFDRSAISYAILPIQNELHLNDLQFGAISSSFGLGYLLTVIFGGILVDKFGSIRIWAISAFLWSIVTMSMGFAQGFISFFLLRLLLGIAEGVHFPALLKTIADWLDIKYRGRALSFSLLGVPLASVIGAPFISLLVEKTSWRSMLFCLGALGILWSFVWIRFFYDKKNPHLSTAPLPDSAKKNVEWKKIFTSLPFISNCAIYFVFGYIIFFGLSWMPGYLEKMHKISISKVGMLLAMPWISSCLLLILGGWVSDYLMKRTKSLRKARTYPIAIGLLLSAISFYILSLMQLLEYQILFLSLAFGFAFSINSPIYALNADLFPSRTGTVQGIMSCSFALAGIISPSLTGWLVQGSQEFTSSLLFVSGFSLAGSLIAAFLQHPPKPQKTVKN